MTEVVQNIDYIYGSSLKCMIGNILDMWFMSEETLRKWERNMKATESSIFVTKLI